LAGTHDLAGRLFTVADVVGPAGASFLQVGEAAVATLLVAAGLT
jgi:hypothetical protein